jgi:tetratricopeptide (TPR) repeat protein
MLKPKKKITKHELKEDQLVSTYFKVTDYLANNVRLLLSIAGGVVAVVLIVVFIIFSRKESAAKASAQLGAIMQLYDSGSFQAAIDGIPARGLIGLKQIAEEHGSTEPGEIAKYYLGNAYFYLKDYDNALKYFEDYGGNNYLIRASVQAGIASVYEAKKQYAEAGKYFERAAALAFGNALPPEYLLNAARDYALAGEKEKALELYKKIKQNFANSSQAREVERFIAEMGS